MYECIVGTWCKSAMWSPCCQICSGPSSNHRCCKCVWELMIGWKWPLHFIAPLLRINSPRLSLSFLISLGRRELIFGITAIIYLPFRYFTNSLKQTIGYFHKYEVLYVCNVGVPGKLNLHLFIIFIIVKYVCKLNYHVLATCFKCYCHMS